MNRHWSSRLIPALVLVPLILAACDPVPPPKSTATEGERSQTKGLEAASMVGYDGKAIRKTVDNTLDQGEQHTEQLNQALKDSTDR